MMNTLNTVTFGRYVYTARYIINLDVDDVTSENSGQRLIHGHTFSSQPYHKPVLYPNPAFDFISIDLRLTDKEIGIVSIFDTFGKLIYRNNLHEQQNKIIINLDKFSSGLYLVKFETNYGLKSSEKFIVTK